MKTLKMLILIILQTTVALIVLWVLGSLVELIAKNPSKLNLFGKQEPIQLDEYIEPTVVESSTDVDETTVEETTLEEQKPYTEEELYMLAHLINGEAGSDWCSDNMLYYVGSVVLNRVNHRLFPNTIEDVIFAKGQYACTWDGNYDREPCTRAWVIARELLTKGSKLPENVVFQATFTQGDGVYCKVQNMYFCYTNR